MRLDISIGPVQEFVSRSRRTRDLWGSSYLLSFLSGHALCGAEKAGGEITRPLVLEDPLFKWVKGKGKGEPPGIGSLPNRLVIKIDDGDAQRIARAAVMEFESAWKRVCNAVWERFVENSHLSGNGTRNIWNRQIEAFWEIMWTASDFDDERKLLARRKRWRSHRPPDEPGDKCTVMHDLQELSGFIRADRRAGRERQKEFWGQIRRCLSPADLREGEQLCAIALVKRLFPKVSDDALGWKIDALHWPSTVYVGAVPWIRKAVCLKPQQASKYAVDVKRHTRDDILTEFPYFNLDLKKECKEFPKLDANYFHREFLKDEQRCPLLEDNNTARDNLLSLLEDLYKIKDKNGRELGQPHPFYALLLADGDRLGKMADEEGEKIVGKALVNFTAEAPEIVRENDGVTIYAGGDDVLAMLPVQKALWCAASLSESYKDAFGRKRGATLSAALVFAHIRLPFSTVIAEAHRLLDEVAKEENGRNSLAAGVLKSGGLNCQWVTTWTRNDGKGDAVSALKPFEHLAEHLMMDTNEPGLSSALVYRIREMISSFCGWGRWQPGCWGILPEDIDIRAFLQAEISRSLAARTGEDICARAREVTELVCGILSRSCAKESSDKNEVGIDALLLALFFCDSEYGENF